MIQRFYFARGISSKLNAHDVHTSDIVVSNRSGRFPVHMIKHGSGPFWDCDWLRSLPGLHGPVRSRLETSSTMPRRRPSSITRVNHSFPIFSATCGSIARVIRPCTWVAQCRCIPTMPSPRLTRIQNLESKGQFGPMERA